jgi:hypothetical protein
MVIFTPLLLYSRGNIHPYALVRELVDGTASLDGFEKRKTFLLPLRLSSVNIQLERT